MGAGQPLWNQHLPRTSIAMGGVLPSQRSNVERSEHTCPTVPLRYPRRTLS
jgi:hypothetical protein